MPGIGLICIGSELLDGRVVNSNATEIGRMLQAEGYKLKSVISVPDHKQALFYALRAMEDKHQIILTTGGLGPTDDDQTTSWICDYFKRGLQEDEAARLQIMEICRNKGIEFHERHGRQALIPDGSSAMPNEVGTAPGFRFEAREGLWIMTMPGIPFEMRHMMKKSVLPWIKQNYDPRKGTRFMLKTFGIPEADIAQRLHQSQITAPEGVDLSFLPENGIVSISVQSHEKNRLAAEKLFHSIRENLSPWVFSEGDEQLNELLAGLATKHDISLATAESCTGGGIAAEIVKVEGAGDWFRGGIVSYQIPLKTGILEVNKETIDKYGVVSRETAIEMAEGVRKLVNADTAISVTGIAGDGGLDDDGSKPGIWIGYSDPQGSDAAHFFYHADRENNIRKTIQSALFFCLKKLRQRFE